MVGTDSIPGATPGQGRPVPPALAYVTPGSLAPVPAGPFWYGHGAVPDEAPRRRVVLPAFTIERTEVTTAQYRRFVADRGYQRRQLWSAAGWAWKASAGVAPLAPPEDHPMVRVSYHEAEAYCRWAGRALPSEAQWEKAARGTDGRRFPWGDKADPLRSNHWIHKHAPPTTSAGSWPAASWPRGQSPFGALHMAGNVWEWTSGRYDAAAQTGARRSGPRWRVIRGGDWSSLLSYQRTTHREPAAPGERRPSLGFRCVGQASPGEGAP